MHRNQLLFYIRALFQTNERFINVKTKDYEKNNITFYINADVCGVCIGTREIICL